jgi:hypothetical protein
MLCHHSTSSHIWVYDFRVGGEARYLSHISLLSPDWSLGTWESTFKKWSQVKDLRLIGNPNGFPSKDVLASTPGELPSLRTLKMRNLNRRRAIPPTTANTLHTLVLFKNFGMEESPFVDLLCHHSASLRRISIRNVHFRDKTALVLNRLEDYAPHLEEMHVHCSLDHLAPAAFLHIPPSVVLLAFDFAPVAPTECIRYLEGQPNNPLNSLKSLSLRLFEIGGVGDIIATQKPWEEVMKVVKGSDIAFHCSGFKGPSEYWNMGYLARRAK